MATQTPEITENYGPITDSELRLRLDHQDEILHAILEALTALRKLATPEAVALLDKLVNNPAAKWRRRNGGPE